MKSGYKEFAHRILKRKQASIKYGFSNTWEDLTEQYDTEMRGIPFTTSTLETICDSMKRRGYFIREYDPVLKQIVEQINNWS